MDEVGETVASRIFGPGVHIPFVMRGRIPRIYPLGRPDRVVAPRRVGPRIACAGDSVVWRYP